MGERDAGRRAARSRCRAATGPSRGHTTPGLELMSERSQDLHLPGVRAPGGAAAPARRPAAELLRPGGAQRADRAPGAPAPGTARPRSTTRRGGSGVADEAYRAVFLRVHPTGKMVLSLTTEPDGKEQQYAQLVGHRARGPGAGRQGRAGRPRPLRRGPRLQHVPVGRRPPAAIVERDRQDQGQGPAARGRRARAPAGRLQWDNGAFIDERSGAAARRSPTSRCTPTGPARSRRGSRAASTRRRSTATTGRPPSSVTSTSSATLSAPNRAEYGLIPQSVCLTVARAVSLPPAPSASRTPAARLPDQLELALGRCDPVTELDRPRWSGTRSRPLQDLVVDRLPDVLLVVIVESLHPAAALSYAQR